jgi:hypothetical protein
MPRLFASMIRFSIWSDMPSPCRPPTAFASWTRSTAVREVPAVDPHRPPVGELDGDVLGLDRDRRIPERDAHDRETISMDVSSSSRRLASCVAPQMFASVEYAFSAESR